MKLTPEQASRELNEHATHCRTCQSGKQCDERHRLWLIYVDSLEYSK